MPKILFIAAHRPGRSPSQRFRFEQYFQYLEEKGVEYDFSFLLSEWDDRFFYSSGHFFIKIFIVVKSFFKRCYDIIRASRYDIIYIQREAFMTGTTFFERRFKKSGTKIVFDFDDAIWINDTSAANKKYEWLKKPDKTATIISIADSVIAGNSYLADYAKKYNTNVNIIPTTIDTAYHQKQIHTNANGVLCIGWTGSITTIKHFEFAVPILKRLKEKYQDKISFKVIGDDQYYNAILNIKGIKWNLETEVKELTNIDIGIMPLPDNEWTKGKCGFKALQYMALGIPVVISPVGVNNDIVNDGVNGFLASDEKAWIEKLSRLIEDKQLREKIGVEARKTIIEKYSVDSHEESYLKCFNELLK